MSNSSGALMMMNVKNMAANTSSTALIMPFLFSPGDEARPALAARTKSRYGRTLTRAIANMTALAMSMGFQSSRVKWMGISGLNKIAKKPNDHNAHW